MAYLQNKYIYCAYVTFLFTLSNNIKKFSLMKISSKSKTENIENYRKNK